MRVRLRRYILLRTTHNRISTTDCPTASPNMVKSARQMTARPRTRNDLQNSRKFKGVRLREWGKWVSEVRMPNSRERIWLGSYDTPHQAARAFDAALYCLRGPKGQFNFPDTLPKIPSANSLSRAQIQTEAARYALESCSAEIPGTPPRSSHSETDSSTADSQQISEEEEELAFWESLFTPSDDGFPSILGGFPCLSPSYPPPQAESDFSFEQDDLWNWSATW